MSAWRVAPRGYDRKMAHVFREVETVRGITYWRSACGKKTFTMNGVQLEGRVQGQRCCASCERNVRAARGRKAA